jgi:hypothetical protein
MPDDSPREHHIERTPTEARQGETPGVVRYVLAWSLIGCGVLCLGLIVYVVGFLR